MVLAVSSLAYSQAWPDRPIRMVVGAPAGGSADFVARMVADKFSKSLGHSVVVDNRPGAGGVLAVKAVVNSKPDGNTLLLFFADNLTIAPQLTKVHPYDALKELDYAGAVARSLSFILTVHPDVQAKTFEDFVKLAKAQPATVSYATYGLGSYPQLSFEMMNAQGGFELLHIPFKGGVESQQAVVAGNVNAVAGINVIELVKAGKLRPLAIGGNKRSTYLPAVPTFAELGYGDQIFGPVVYGVATPAGTPKEVLDRLATETRKVAEAPDAIEKLGSIVSEPFWANSEQVKTMVRQAMSSYAPIIKRLGLAQ